MNSFIELARQDLSGVELSAASLVREGIALAVRVNTFVGLKGVEKKELIVKTLLNILEEKKSSALKALDLKEPGAERDSQVVSIELQYSLLETTVKEAVPVAIDAAVAAARGGLKLKKITAPRFLSCLICGFQKIFSAIQESEKIRGEMKIAASQVPEGLVVREVVPEAAAGVKLEDVVSSVADGTVVKVEEIVAKAEEAAQETVQEAVAKVEEKVVEEVAAAVEKKEA